MLSESFIPEQEDEPTLGEIISYIRDAKPKHFLSKN